VAAGTITVDLCASGHVEPGLSNRTASIASCGSGTLAAICGRIRAGGGAPTRNFPVNGFFGLKLAGRLTGKSDQVERLLGSLQVDSGKIRRELGWTPPFTLQEGLRLTARPA
jgi:UDP-glucose 4-epimerase